MELDDALERMKREDERRVLQVVGQHGIMWALRLLAGTHGTGASRHLTREQATPPKDVTLPEAVDERGLRDLIKRRGLLWVVERVDGCIRGTGGSKSPETAGQTEGLTGSMTAKQWLDSAETNRYQPQPPADGPSQRPKDPPSKEPTCLNCRFSATMPPPGSPLLDRPPLQCRRWPPGALPNIFPGTYPEVWCGEHQPRP